MLEQEEPVLIESSDSVEKKPVVIAKTKSAQPISNLTVLSQLLVLAGNGEVEKLFSEDFEDGGFMDSGECSGNCPDVLEEQGGAGKFMRATLSGSMKVPYRTELSFNKSSSMLVNQRTYLLVFRVRMHTDTGQFPKSMFVQVHAKNWLEDQSKKFWQPFVGRLNENPKTGFWQCEKSDGKNLKTPFSVRTKKWEQYEAVLRFRNDSDGTILVFRGHELIFKQQGVNCGDWKEPLYLKMGIYTGKKNSVPEGSVRNVDYDDVGLFDISKYSNSLAAAKQFVGQLKLNEN